MSKRVQCHRQADPADNRVYLTFDDGPMPGCTDSVLDVLKRHQSKATFFLVANKAASHPLLLARILSEGHTIGNHSLDHGYGAFFASRNSMLKWVQRSEEKMIGLTGLPSVGWRSPAGIQTPPLHEALLETGIPLIRWSNRFYDALHPWTKAKAEKALPSIAPGAIILLHDVQKEKNQRTFLATLDYFIGALKSAGLRPDCLRRADLLPPKAERSVDLVSAIDRQL